MVRLLVDDEDDDIMPTSAGSQTISIIVRLRQLFRAIGAAGYGAADAKISPTNNLETSTSIDAAESSAFIAASRVHDRDLADLLAAWPSLPDALKAGILAMVKAAML